MCSIVEQFVRKGYIEGYKRGLEIGRKKMHDYYIPLFGNVLRLMKQGKERKAIAEELNVPLEDVNELADIITANL